MALEIRVRIGGEEQVFSNGYINEPWINQRIARRQQEGPVCVNVRIRAPQIDVALSSGACGGSNGGGGGRRPTAVEASILEEWSTRGLDQIQIAGGQLIAFLKRLRSRLL